MTRKEVKNVAASVRSRLLARAKTNKEDFQLVLTRFVNERFLYRLSRSEHASRFVLKGATSFLVWRGNPHRATRDLDLLGFGASDPDSVRKVLTAVFHTDVEDDGVVFDLSTLSVGPTRTTRNTVAFERPSRRVSEAQTFGFRSTSVSATRSRQRSSSSMFPQYSTCRPRDFARTRARRLSPRKSKRCANSDSRTRG